MDGGTWGLGSEMQAADTYTVDMQYPGGKCTSEAVRKASGWGAGRELAYGEASVLLPPELCLVHPLKCASLAAAKYVPSLLWWVHTLLLAAELREKLSPPGK